MRPSALERVAPIAWILRGMERLAQSLARQYGMPWLADDLTQLGLETACRLAPTYDTSRGAFTTFLHPYARGAMLNMIGRERAGRARFAAHADLEDTVFGARASRDVEPADETPSAEDVLIEAANSRARAAFLDRTLRELRPTERQLVQACLLGGRPASEVSKELGLGVRTARRRLERIAARLKRAGGAEHRR